MKPSDIQTIILGGGCFWCTEAIFTALRGIISVTPGYAGGTTANPSYDQVCSGTTGHAEVIQVEFDSSIIPLTDVLDIFFHTHNPTSRNQQGNDIGTQYRSIILYTNQDQHQTINKIIGKLNSSKEFDRPIITEVKPLDHFYPAENYHRDYYLKNTNQPYCQIIISPKLQHLKQKYASQLKPSL